MPAYYIVAHILHHLHASLQCISPLARINKTGYIAYVRLRWKLTLEAWHDRDLGDLTRLLVYSNLGPSVPRRLRPLDDFWS